MIYPVMQAVHTVAEVQFKQSIGQTTHTPVVVK